MRKLFLSLAGAAALSSCVHGPQLERLAYPSRPEGAGATISVGPHRYAGELVTVGDTGFVLLRRDNNRLTFISTRAVAWVEVESLGRYRQTLRADDLRKIRLVSRHPYGLTAETRATLLAGHRQADFDVLAQ
jgi:hypothetical protein